MDIFEHLAIIFNGSLLALKIIQAFSEQLTCQQKLLDNIKRTDSERFSSISWKSS